MTWMAGAFATSNPPGFTTEHIPNEQCKKNNHNINLEENNWLLKVGVNN